MVPDPVVPGLEQQVAEIVGCWKRMLSVPQPQTTDRIAGEPIENVIAGQVIQVCQEHYAQAIEDAKLEGFQRGLAKRDHQLLTDSLPNSLKRARAALKEPSDAR